MTAETLSVDTGANTVSNDSPYKKHLTNDKFFANEQFDLGLTFLKLNNCCQDLQEIEELQKISSFSDSSSRYIEKKEKKKKVLIEKNIQIVIPQSEVHRNNSDYLMPTTSSKNSEISYVSKNFSMTRSEISEVSEDDIKV